MLPLSTATNGGHAPATAATTTATNRTAAAGASRPERFRVTYGIGDGNGLRLSPVGEVRDGDLSAINPQKAARWQDLRSGRETVSACQTDAPLHEVHEERGAKFTDFGGWQMPVEFASISEEHAAVRDSLGVFDVSHMGEIEVSGPDATRLMNRLTTNDVTALDPGDSQYAAITNEDGVMLDDTVVYRLPDGIEAGDGAGALAGLDRDLDAGAGDPRVPLRAQRRPRRADVRPVGRLPGQRGDRRRGRERDRRLGHARGAGAGRGRRPR